jgi:hypothetical protein
MRRAGTRLTSRHYHFRKHDHQDRSARHWGLVSGLTSLCLTQPQLSELYAAFPVRLGRPFATELQI